VHMDESAASWTSRRNSPGDHFTTGHRSPESQTTLLENSITISPGFTAQKDSTAIPISCPAVTVTANANRTLDHSGTEAVRTRGHLSPEV